MEKNNELMRKGNDWSSEKQDLEGEINRMHKEQMQLKKTIDRIDRDRIQQQELCSKLQTENKELLQSTRRLEEENLDLRRDLQKLQAFKTQQEETQAARLVEVNTKQRLEAENEMEQQRSALAQAEKALQIRERSHRHRVRCLEEQDIVLSGLYKPTAAPSRYDPYYYQVTGSIPARLDRSYGASRIFNRERESGSSQRATHNPSSIIPRDGDSHQSLTEGTEGNGKSGLRSGACTSNIIHSSTSRMSALFGEHGYHESTPSERLNRSISESLIRRHLER
ncbi:hypothetical protein P879_06460 [Paragonimus westermani]|uniref:Uncharacterized protein n=1 Tax=Paragonimus westermani TaxID=34504 RepID=A0A8T0DLI2_9TREM|nr:hypothetical protein P879_06460 [Paragonimus westermani]